MGKKDKNKKKGKGAEKTNQKTEKKFALKQKKLLSKIGEVDILEIVDKLEKEEASRKTAIEVKCDAPSPRSNFTLVSHPDKDELILFGGEYFDGQKTVLYNDLFFYNISKGEWRQLKSAGGCPTPRSGHQMVTTSTDGGQLWLFGGEYASPSQLQFIHFKDLWVFRLNQKKWEKIQTGNEGPSARSGHRMLIHKKKIFLFGGFHDTGHSYRYFNDVFTFSLEDYIWQEIKVGGVNPPPPRSGCCFAACPDGKLVVWGGYSKSPVKKELDKGTTHWDSYTLVQDKNDPKAWKWVSVKIGGVRPPPRSGMTAISAPNGKLYVFGGVMDVEEDDETLKGQYSNELLTLDTSALVWRRVELAGKKKKAKDVEMVEEKEEASSSVQTFSDGVFTVTVAGNKSNDSFKTSKKDEASINEPSPRSHVGLAICKGNLYLYGGLFEEDERQYTLTDFYSLDIHKNDQWKTLIKCNLKDQEWLESESDDSENDDSDESDEESDDDSDDDSEMDTD